MWKPFTKVRDRLKNLYKVGHRYSTVLSVFSVLLLVAVGIVIVWTIPKQQVKSYGEYEITASNEKRAILEDAFRKTLSQIVLSIFGLLLLYFTWRRTRAGDATLRVAEQSHITDRYTKAIEQLGRKDGDRPNLEVRLGAIYALERIASDSVRDHWPIMEVLTAYIRQNAPLSPEKLYVDGESPTVDIQAILTVLGRRETGPGREDRSNQQYLNLMRTRLCGAHLSDANLRGVDLEKADLRGVSFWGVNLQGAALMGADLSNTEFLEANLNGTFFRGALMTGANVEKADFRNAVELTPQQIWSAKNWRLALYSPKFDAELRLAEPSESSASDEFE